MNNFNNSIRQETRNSEKEFLCGCEIMIKEVIHDPIFLAGKSESATKEDLQVAQDLLDTLIANKDGCVGMAANMIGARKRIIVFDNEGTYVQDLSYLILRSIFRELEFENPHFKSGGTNSKVDLMIEKEGIDIELKMIKAKDKDEKEFVKQLKIDFNDYAAWNGLRDLIVFVYDPFNKTTNKNNFYSLEGQQIIRGVSFNVHIIVSN